MKRFFLWSALILLVGASGTQAEMIQDDVNNPYQLNDSITVTANRAEVPIEEIGSTITIINRKQIQQSQTNSLSEIVRTIPGVDVVRSGGVGHQTSIFLRGSGSHHTLVLVDGVKMNDPSSPNSSYDFGSLNLDNVERIEILQGPQSVLYGSDAIGGVINLITNRGYGKPVVTLSAETGSYGSFRESVWLSGGSEKFDYSLSLGREDTDGISATAIEGETEEKDGYSATTASLNSAFRPIAGLEFNLTGRYIDASADIDQTSDTLHSFDDSNSTSDNQQSSLSIKFKADKIHPRVSVNGSVYFMKQELHSRDEIDEDRYALDFFSGDTLFFRSDYDTKGLRRKAELLSRFQIIDNYSLTVGIENERESFESTLDLVSGWGPYTDTVNSVYATTTSLFALNQFNISQRLFGTVGIRFDDHHRIGTETTVRTTLAYHLENIGTRLKAAYGTGFKEPSLFQLLHPLWGNADLLPEKSRGWEVGVEKILSDSKVQLGITYFYNRYIDLISGSTNIAQARSKGWEVRYSLNLQRIQSSFTYNYLKAFDKNSNEALIRRPKTKLSLSVNFAVNDKLYIGIRARTVSERTDTDFNVFPTLTVHLEKYAIADLTTSYQVTGSITIRARVENLFDESYQEVLNYQSPGRTGHVGFSVGI